MKKSIFTVAAVVGLLAVTTSFSSTDVIEVQTKVRSEVSHKDAKTQTFKIRYGLLSKSGTKILSGSGFDLGGFIAENTATGETYYSNNGYNTVLPQYSEEDLPAGTYAFSGIQGQGGWVGYGTVVATVSEANVDADGYITIYVPITWEE
ncbi:hypothetical protein EG359_10865 [Chryseobacterium joostei]|uniref:DUF4879 domain-containing protein n=2 Tax=Chryseobacterium TaxID=59732 RepID=A0A1N7IGG7_9FLAO|nr:MULTISPECIES: hypothetical protein [Chryseobacterium]AZB00092.1 hypothetical protein EG359_10865 [Chryseobacterium joostei]PWN63190.1 hypothetical protein C1638_014025 [Chryseobacterium oncorhynchi]SIS36165.1 hypothetical protein SAMN05421768_10595 [Chryseobacterium joostei]HCM33752.1 hypothetical protein [Chryseobacterium sp.]